MLPRKIIRAEWNKSSSLGEDMWRDHNGQINLHAKQKFSFTNSKSTYWKKAKNILKKTLILAFVNYGKSFDLVQHLTVFNSLSEQAINKNHIRIGENIYGNNTVIIWLDKSNIKIWKEVRQGIKIFPQKSKYKILFVSIIYKYIHTNTHTEVLWKVLSLTKKRITLSQRTYMLFHIFIFQFTTLGTFFLWFL